jgi:hypothetical protein
VRLGGSLHQHSRPHGALMAFAKLPGSPHLAENRPSCTSFTLVQDRRASAAGPLNARRKALLAGMRSLLQAQKAPGLTDTCAPGMGTGGAAAGSAAEEPEMHLLDVAFADFIEYCVATLQ